jgi:hypothetical protein
LHKRICTDRKGWQRPRPGGPISTVKGEFEGDQYAGSFKDRIRYGVGTYTHPNGHKYVGEWKDGTMHGQGAFTYVDGSKYVGEVKENMPWKGTSYDKDDNVTATYSEGVEKSVN